MHNVTITTWRIIMIQLKARDHGCEEAAPGSSDFYIPCNKPATKIMHHAGHNETYRMCDMCADHNKRRGFVETGEYTAGTPEESKETAITLNSETGYGHIHGLKQEVLAPRPRSIVYDVTPEIIAELKKEQDEIIAKVPADIADLDIEMVKVGYRKVVRVRTTTEKQRKEYKKEVLDYGRMIDFKAEEALKPATEIENNYNRIIDAYDAHLKDLAQKAQLREAARLATIGLRIKNIEDLRSKAAGQNAASIRAIKDEFGMLAFGTVFDYEEFSDKANQIITDTQTMLDNALVEREKFEEQQRILEEQRQIDEQARQKLAAEKAEFEAKQKEYADKMAAMQADIDRKAQEQAEAQRQIELEKERAELHRKVAIERKIEEIKNFPAKSFGMRSGNLGKLIDDFSNKMLEPFDYMEYKSIANQAMNQTVFELNEKLKVVIAREKEEEQAANAEREAIALSHKREAERLAKIAEEDRQRKLAQEKEDLIRNAAPELYAALKECHEYLQSTPNYFNSVLHTVNEEAINKAEGKE